jgi:alpha-mannosidase
LYQAELFATWATILNQRSPYAFDYPHIELETAWKKVLFNQFHDILPGSAIPQVYVEANQDWLEVEQTGQRILQEALAAIAQHMTLPAPPQSNSRPIVVFNTLNWERSEVVAVPLPPDPLNSNWHVFDPTGQLLPVQIQSAEDGAIALCFQTTPIPGLGYAIFWLSHSPVSLQAEGQGEITNSLPVHSSSQISNDQSNPASPYLPIHKPDLANESHPSFTLENRCLRVTIDPNTGEIAELFDKVQQRQMLQSPTQLQAYQDSGQYWDAWNIDPNYAQYPLPPALLQSISWLDQGHLLSRLRVVRQLGRSQFVQDYVLEVNSPVLKVVTQVDWQEQHVLVKAILPLSTDPTAPVTHTTYETACGAIQRPINSSDPHEQSKWEVPALQWADFGNHQYGVSLLNDGKHGYSAQPSQLSLTLLRSPTWPDPAADRGLHQFTYALYPHADSWQTALTVRRAYELNQPLIVKDWEALLEKSDRPLPSSTSLPPTSQFFNLSSNNLILMACKQAETNQHWILRFYECHGETAALKLDISPETWGTNDYTWQVVDLLEQSINSMPKPLSEAHLISPWKIISCTLQS